MEEIKASDLDAALFNHTEEMDKWVEDKAVFYDFNQAEEYRKSWITDGYQVYRYNEGCYIDGDEQFYYVVMKHGFCVV